MKLFIPELGTVLKLSKSWTFTVLNERRNATLATLMGYEFNRSEFPLFPFGSYHHDSIFGTRVSWDKAGNRTEKREEHKYYRPTIGSVKHTWPRGTELVVDRIYIRQGNSSFSSVTFKTIVKGKTVRFFAKLADVNKIEFEEL